MGVADRVQPGPLLSQHLRRARRVIQCGRASTRPESDAHRRHVHAELLADAGLFVDECQNFLNLPYPLEDMLAEARAYRLSVVMAHQDLAQLPADLREGISANPPVPGHLQRQPRGRPRPRTPHPPAPDLSHLGAYQAAAKLLADSADAPAFTLRTQPLPPSLPGRARLIRAAGYPAARAAGQPPAARLTGRDRWLLRMLHEHRVLTATQITQLAFGTTRAAGIAIPRTSQLQWVFGKQIPPSQVQPGDLVFLAGLMAP